MKQHMREFFVSRLRTGLVFIRRDDRVAIVHSPTLLQSLVANQFAADAYEEAEFSGVMSKDEMLEWMIEKEMWGEEDEERIEGLTKDLEKLRIAIYHNRENDFLREEIRKGIRAGESQLSETSAKKSEYEINTCDGIALLSRYRWIVENCCTFEDNTPYTFEDMSAEYIIAEYQNSFLSEKQLRELARTEPWKSQWSVSKNSGKSLFLDPESELTQDQKGILIWASMYDNIQEHMECPPDEVLEDDDVLDGWFLVQREKRKREKLEQEFEDKTSDKIKNANEVFIVGDLKKSQSKADAMNDPTATMHRRSREAQIKRKGHVQQGEFFDEQLDMRKQQSDSYKNKFRS
jgi:hypothetical protein